MRSILDHQKRRAVLHRKIQHAYNMGMVEANQHLCFLEKAFGVFVLEHRAQNFDGGVALKVDMLAQVHLGKAALSQQTQQSIVPKWVANAISHLPLLEMTVHSSAAS